jgi:hypothetical protein
MSHVACSVGRATMSTCGRTGGSWRTLSVSVLCAEALGIVGSDVVGWVRRCQVLLSPVAPQR